MNEKIADFIIGSLWSFFLFGLWLLLSFFQGTGGQWWSLFNVDLGRPSSDSALGISFFRMFIVLSLSMLIAYLLTSWWGRKKQ